ncbi:MAG: hypothetical protein HYT16_04125 [DPANN group archaeon]|nr:hypothetical protein [DPANN group archaeon]
MAEGAVWSVGVGFILLGLLNYAWQAGGPWNWVIAGVVALLVGMYGPKMMR